MATTSQECTLEVKTGENTSEEIKIPASSVDGLSTVATSGSYNDLSNKPTIPSVPTNYVTTDTAQDITGAKKFYNNTKFSNGIQLGDGNTLIGAGDVDNIENIMPQKDGTLAVLGDIPTKVSELANDSGFTTNKGTVTQVKINGTTKSPNSAGLVDLGTIGGGVQVLTANEVNISSLSNGVYLWKFSSGYSTYTLSGIGSVNSPQKFTFKPEKYSKLATLEVNRDSTTYINFTLSYDVPTAISSGGKKTITYMHNVGKIEEYSNWIEPVDVSVGTGGALTIIDDTVKTANLKVTLLPDATTEGETTNVTVSIGGYSSTNIKNIIKSSDKFPMNLVFERTRGGLLISETALDGAFDSFGNSDDSGIYDDEIYLGVKYTSDRSSITTDYMLNGTLISPITYS